MRVGSVRFYKRLFLTILVLLIVVPIALCVMLGVRSSYYRDEVEDLQAALRRREEEVAALQAAMPSPAPDETPAPPEPPEWQALYPDLVAQVEGRSTVNEDKTVYLTFDDGPSERTDEILAILEEYGVKATFFPQGREDGQSLERLRAIAGAGHALGVHTYSHDYGEIYSSVGSFLADCDAQARLIRESTGVEPELLRFPGGSVNTYSAAIGEELIGEMLRRGFVYFDWNVSGGDTAPGGATAEQIVENALAGTQERRVILLLHDSQGKNTTVEALGDIIEGYQAAGFTFAPLTGAVTPIVFGYGE